MITFYSPKQTAQPAILQSKIYLQYRAAIKQFTAVVIIYLGALIVAATVFSAFFDSFLLKAIKNLLIFIAILLTGYGIAALKYGFFEVKIIGKAFTGGTMVLIQGNAAKLIGIALLLFTTATMIAVMLI